MLPRIIALLSLAIVATTTATAGINFSFGESEYFAAPGETIAVEFYLNQTIGDTTLSGEGLFSFGSSIFFDESPVPSSPAFIESIDRITINSVFDDTSASIIELVPGSSASIGGAVTDPFNAPAGESLLLGTIEFTAGSIVGETTMLRATDLSMLDETVSGIGTPLDSVIQDGFASITVSAVPEPSVAPLLLAAGSIGLFRRRKKSRS